MEYLTWRQLRDRLNGFNAPIDNQLLDEPVLFALLDPYGNMQAYPAELLDNTAYQTLAVGIDEEDVEYELLVNDDPAELAESERRALRQLPPRALLLHYSEMEEDGAEQLAHLAQPNPHTPAPHVLGTAPLFGEA